MYQFMELTQKERILFITLNRPEKRNALSGALVDELKKIFLDAESDNSVKVIILRANGSVFSAGADLDYLQQLQKNSYAENLADSSSLAELFKIIYHHNKVVIAQVEGHAIAGGCGLATVADFTFAVPEAQMGYTEVKIGFIPAIVSLFLVRKVGETKAKELLLTGKLISAEYAKSISLIHEVIEANEIKSFTEQFAQSLCETTSAQSLTWTKELIAKAQELSIEDGLKYAAELNAKCRAEEDCRKGIKAFLNKEKITW
jgi:methylglutaconyl-CoA hydratase